MQTIGMDGRYLKITHKRFQVGRRRKLSEFHERFIQNYDEDSNEGYFLEVDVKYPKRVRILHKDFPFLPGKKNRKSRKTCLWSMEQKKYVVH